MHDLLVYTVLKIKVKPYTIDTTVLPVDIIDRSPCGARINQSAC